MEPLFYSTGQVARQLGTTQAAVRVMCESRAIAAETTPGGQWRVLASEVARLKRDGLPQIPRPLPIQNMLSLKRTGAVVREGNYEIVTQPSEVGSAADQVAIRRSTLETRRIDREIEENEDWFRERQRERAIAEETQQQRAEAEQARQRREEWTDEWVKYALDSTPSNAREMEIEIHAAVDAMLSKLQPSHAEGITQRLVDAAVHLALVPWERKQNSERALQASMDKLPYAIRCDSEYAGLRQAAWEAAVAAEQKIRLEANYDELEAAALLAVQPAINAYEHHVLCRQIVRRVMILGASSHEDEAAKKAVAAALAALSIGARKRDLEQAAEIALVPFKGAVAERKENERRASERKAKQAEIYRRVDSHLSHISGYLEREYEFDGGGAERHREVARLRPIVREVLIDELLKIPGMRDAEIRKCIEDHIDRGV